MAQQFFTSGRTAAMLGISISTLKRWAVILPREKRNASGWLLFSMDDLDMLKKVKRRRRKY